MSELLSVGILAGLALWVYGCCRVGAACVRKTAPEETAPRKARERVSATRSLLLCLLLPLSAHEAAVFAQTATSSVFPANPTYVDAVTGIVTIPAVAGQPPVTGMIDYTIDGGPVATATVSTGNNYVNLGQLSIGSHVLTFQAHPGSPSASPIMPPHPVSIPVTDKSFGFVGVYGRFNSNYTDANLFSSAGLAIDSKDTVWIADSILSKLVSFDIFGNIKNVAIASLPIPIANPAGLAFDSSDNLFISDRGNSRIVKYTPAGVETVLPTPGLGKPGELMLDRTRNLLYIIDQDNERVVRYDLSAMTLAGDPFSGLTAIQSIALDPAGNVYVSDKVARFLKNVDGVVSALPVNAPIAEAGGIYIDRAGLLYLTDSSINGTYRIDAQGHQTQISDFDSSHGMAEDSHGRIYFGTSTNVRTFTPAGELGVAAATTSIFSNSDQNNSLVYTMPHGQTALTQVVSPSPTFVYDIETESCPYFEIRGTCYFDVNFRPQTPGVHTGSIATTLPGGPTITTLLYGSATGPAPAFSPGTQTQTPSGAVLGEAVALDEAGNYYVSDGTGNQVYETSGGVTRSLGFKGLSLPISLAVDGAGAVYVQDSGNNRIAKLDLAGNQTFPVVAGKGNALSSLDTFAMDGGGQIYFAGPAADGTSLYVYDRFGATSLVASGLVESAGLALDPYGDIYSIQVDGSLLRIDFYGKQLTLAPAGTFHDHTALAVDASETAYVAQDGVAAITLFHPGGTTESIPVADLNHVGGIAINGAGSILAVDAYTNNFIFVDRTHQDFNFGDVPVNTTKTFAAFFGNAGTQTFQITGLPGDSDFRQVTSADACNTSGANATVASASSCNLSYTVAPTVIGAITAYSGVATNFSVDYDTFTENTVRVPVAPTFLPAALSFGNVNVGAIATQTLTLTNQDTAPLIVGAISVTGSFSITGASPCKQNGTIAVGGSCSFTVQFAPAAAGMATSAVAVQYTGGSATANLSGTGVAAPTATLTPESYNFGNVTVGASSGAIKFQLTNTSSVSVTLSDVSVTGSGFHLLGKAGTLEPGTSTTFEVAFLPTSTGAVTGTLSAATSAGTLTTTLTGTGVAPTATLTPASYNFGNVTVGASSGPVKFQLTNTSGVSVTLSDVSVTGSGFHLLGKAGTLAPGTSTTFEVAFLPTSMGSVTGTLSAVTSAGTLTTTLTGTGVAPTATLTPASYNFGNVTVGASSGAVNFQLTNTSAASVTISDVSVTGSGFHLLGKAGTLAPGASTTFQVAFLPTSMGSVTGTLSAVTSAGTLTTTLTGTGVAPTATLTPASYNFGNVTVGASSGPVKFQLTNTSGVSVTLSDVSVTGSGFHLMGKAGTLAPGTSTTFEVAFLPTSMGSVTGTLSAVTSAGTLTTTLTGTGVAPTATLTPASYNFGNVTVGASSGAIKFQLTNTSGVSVTLSDVSVTGSGFHLLGKAGTLAPGTSTTFEVAFLPTSMGSVTGTLSAVTSAGTLTTTLTGTGVAPKATLTPASYNFGNVTVGASSGPVKFQLTNTSGVSVTLSDVSVTGSGFHLLGKPGTLAPGASTTFQVAFLPTSTGAATGTLSAFTSAGTLITTLTGTGVTPTATLTPASYNFGNVTVGATSNQLLLKFTNTGTTTLHPGNATGTLRGLQFPATAATTCTGSSGNTVVTLSPGGSCILAVDFAPTTAGIQTGVVSIPSEAGNTIAAIVGTGVAPTATLTPATYNFGSVTAGSTSSQLVLRLTNTSNVPLHTTGSLSSSPAFVLLRTATTCTDTTVLAPGGACDLPVDFSPTAVATVTGTISIGSEAGTETAALTGTGIAPTATLTPASYNFGDVTVGTTSGQVLLKFTNTSTGILHPGNAAGTVRDLHFLNTASTTCTGSTGSAVVTLSPGASCILAIDFAPTTAGTQTGTVSIPSEAGNTIATIAGTGVAPSATLTPATYNFGSVTVGSASSQLVLKLTNTSSASLHLTGSLSSSPAFVLLKTSTTCTDTTLLASGGTCDLPVDFSPTAVGTVTGTISIGGDAGTKTVVLTGTGVAPAPPPTVSPAALSFGNVTVGATSPAQIVTLTNPATFPLTLTSIGLNGSGFSIQSTGTTCKTGPAIAAGASCKLSVIFSPAVAGAVSGSLTIGLPPGFAVSSLAVSLTGTGVSSVVSPEDIDFTSGFTANGLTLNGAAAVSGGVLQLTTNQPSQASAAFYPTPVSTASFSTDFAFQLLDPLAEGITFTIQGDGPKAIGSNGGGLGYQGIAKSIALKFDLKDTAGEGVDSTGIYIDGAPPTVPATSLAASGIDLHSGDVFALHVSYDGTTESISLTDTVTGAVWTTQAAENIPSIVGGSQAYFGFTASTGATSASSASIKPAAMAASTSVGTTANIIYWAYANRSEGVAALEPIQLNFGNVTVGSTSNVQSAELVNTGTAQFQVSSIAPSDPSILVHSSYCARPVTPGNYCKLEVTVAPTASGAFSGSVAINYYLGDGSTPSQNFTSTLKITGTSTVSGVTLSPASANFGSINQAQVSSPKIFTLTNDTASAVTLTRITIGEDSTLPFQTASGATCISEGQLPAGKSCTIPVVFAPESTGANSGALYVSYLDASDRAVTETASLTGTAIAAPIATLTPTRVDFGNVMVGSVALTPAWLQLTNTGTLPVTASAYTLTGSGFSLAGGFCGDPIPAGGSCTVMIAFQPTVAGVSNGSFGLTTNAGTKTVSLTGVGVAPPAPTATLTPTRVDFGNVILGAALPPAEFQLTNTGTVPVTVSAYTLTGSGFSLAGGFCGDPIPAGGSCTALIAFQPTVAGVSNGSFGLTTNAGTKTVSLTGVGVAPPTPMATLTPLSYNFGDVQLGAPVQAEFQLTNTGTLPVTVSDYTFTGSGFSTVGQSEACLPAIVAGSPCMFLLEFTPPVAGASTGSFILKTNAGDFTIALTGTGVAPPPTTPFINFGTGFTADALTLTGPANTAGGALQLTSGPSSAASSAFYPTPVPTNSFDTSFTFQLLDPTAEGITFTIQGDGPNAVGLGGGGLGYQGLAKSIAVKFDLKDTAGEGADSTGIYVNGAAPTVPATPLAESDIDLHSGHIFSLHLSYDGATMAISLIDTFTNAIWTMQAAKDIPEITGGSTAYFGFTAGSGTPTLTSDVAESERAELLRPATTLSAATSAPATSNILTWIYVANGAMKASQTITFPSLAAMTYGAGPIHLAATAASGLPVSYSVTGPANLSGATLTLTGAGEVSVTATQSGNASFVAAVPVTRSFAVAKAPLTVTANSALRAYGTSNPAFTYKLSGFVDGDTATVVGGTAVLATTAVPNSPAGNYPITFTSEGLTAANYSFVYVAATLTVTPGTLVVAPSSGNFGSISLGKMSPLISFTVTNNTPSTMGYLGYTNLGEFYLQPGTCHLVNGEPMLKPGQSCIFTAVFKPTKLGPVGGNLSIQTSSGTFNVPMTGTGSTQ